MNIFVAEDEMPAFKRLSKLLAEVAPTAVIAGHADSIAQAKEWFETHPRPDLLLLDIHLADGSGFDLLREIKPDCPVIFITAYNEYAFDAFKTVSIDCLLKPLKKEELAAALGKLKQFQSILTRTLPQETQTLAQDYKKRFLVRFGEHIKTLSVTDIAYFYSENKATFARTYEARNYPIDHNLDALERMLDPQDFFRINRQYLINMNAIEEMRSYTKARVIVKLKPAVKEPPVVSSERAADFKDWLAGEYK